SRKCRKLTTPSSAFDGDPVQAPSWLFDLVYQVSQNVADHGSIDLLVQRHGSVSMALDLHDAPKGLECENEQVGMLLAPGASTIDAADAHRAAAGRTGVYQRGATWPPHWPRRRRGI
ncbi:MAG: hypothetical protein RSF79_21765, partial [Janthinobacterium sp.]